MTDTNATPVEPLTPTLEETARSIAHEWMERLGYAKGIPEQAQRWLDAGEHEDFDAVYDLKKTLRFVRFVLERMPRDDTAELVEALEVARNRLYGIDTARNRGFDLHYAEGSARAGVREIDAVLARVKGGAK